MSLLETYYLGLASKTNFVLRSILVPKRVLLAVCESFALWAKASGARVVDRLCYPHVIVLLDLLVVCQQCVCTSVVCDCAN